MHEQLTVSTRNTEYKRKQFILAKWMSEEWQKYCTHWVISNAQKHHPPSLHSLLMPCSPPFFNIHNLGANKLGHSPFFFYSFFMAPIQLLFTAKFGCILMKLVSGPKC